MTPPAQRLLDAFARIPHGRYAVAVSGGADSVALLHLLAWRRELEPVVVHLDHETRAGESTRDAEFVMQLAERLGYPAMVRRRSELEQGEWPANVQARYRALRLELYRQAIDAHSLAGVLQAHHADDQAETVFMRLARGAGIEGLAGMAAESVVEGVRILRPLLAVRREELRRFLVERSLSWREDVTNATPAYQRNRVRQLLTEHPRLIEPLLQLQRAMAALVQDLDAAGATQAGERLSLRRLRELHPLLQLHVLRGFALRHGAASDDLSLDLLERLRALVEDAAAGPAVSLPGAVEIRRRAGELIARPLSRPAE